MGEHMKKIKNFYKYTIIIITISTLFSLKIHYVQSACKIKNVLDLNSYHKGLSWTDQETAGITHTIDKSNINPKIKVVTYNKKSIKEILQSVKQVTNNSIILITVYDSYPNKQNIRAQTLFKLVRKKSSIKNKPFNFFKTYKKLYGIALIIFALLILFICILLLNLKKITRLKKVLYNNNIVLGDLYRDLESSDKELKRQFEELKRVQKDLYFTEKQYKLLFDKMLNGFIVYETVVNSENEIVDLRYVHANAGAEIQLNRKLKKFIGRTWSEVIGYKNPYLDIYNNIIYTGEAKKFEAYYLHRKDIYLLINAFRISENRIGIIFDNILEYKNAIKEIQILNEQLEKRVSQRTIELQDAVNQLEAFNHTVSHDMKSPVRAIDGYSKIILEDFGEMLEEDIVEMIWNIRNICRDMIEMINKLLLYSTISKAALQKNEVDMKELFQSTFSEERINYLERDIKLIIENELPKVMVDRILLKEVICNIISNSIKFTRNRDKSIIKVGSTTKDKEYVFYVKDNGAGFDMEFSAKLFGLFQRLHDKDEFEGNGIGLTIVKNIIQKHGGKVWIEGKCDIGATIYFTVPV
jgi:signal transduction histidine kinase